MEVFFIRFRKVLLFASGFMFLYFFYEVYNGISSMSSGNKGAGIGTLIDACISVFVSVYFFINVRKAKKAFKEENVTVETNNDNNPNK